MPRPAPRLALMLLPCAPFWTGCASPPAPIAVPDSLRTCRAEPPAPPAPDDVDLAAWIAEAIFAGRDCRSALARLVELLP